MPDRWTDGDLESIIGRVGSFEPGETLGEDYEVVDLLGKGAQAEVYIVRNRNDEREYVAKIFVGDSENRLFRYERDVFSKLAELHSHQNLVKAHPAIRVGEHSVHILEYIKGVTLTEHIQSHRLKPRHAVIIVRQILDALAHLHGAGIVHRDVKPDNVKITGHDQHAVLFDFSVAVPVKDKDAPYSGTPEYSPPEKEVSAGWDIYSCGVVLHVLATGRLPIWEQGGLKPADASDLLVLPKELELHPIIKACLKKALAYEPTDRFPDAKQMRRALSVTHFPHALLYSGRRWVFDYPFRFITLLMMMTVICGVWWLTLHRSSVRHTITVNDIKEVHRGSLREHDRERASLKEQIEMLSASLDRAQENLFRAALSDMEQLKSLYELNLPETEIIFSNFVSNMDRDYRGLDQELRDSLEERAQNHIDDRLQILNVVRRVREHSFVLTISEIRCEFPQVSTLDRIWLSADKGDGEPVWLELQAKSPRVYVWKPDGVPETFSNWRADSELELSFFEERRSWFDPRQLWRKDTPLESAPSPKRLSLAELQPYNRDAPLDGGWIQWDYPGPRVRIEGRFEQRD